MNKRQNTLIILTPGFAANEQDTTCLPFLQTLVTAFNEQYPAVKIIILAFQYPFIDATYQWKNNEVISFNGGNKGKIARLQLWLHVWRTLKELKKQYHIEGLLSLWCTECALVGKYFGLRHKVKHYIWLCGQDAKKDNKYVKLIQPTADSLIAMSDFLQETFYNNHKVKPAHVIPIGIDPQLFLTDTRIRDIDILGVGSLIPLKQYDIFISIVKEIAQVLPDIKAMVCGKGPEENKLKSQIDQLEITNNITFTGEKTHSEILGTMQRSRIFMHTSSYEGFGTVCLEALYAGTHVVSFTKPMKQEIRHWHTVNTKEEMFEKVLALLQDVNTDHTPVTFYTMKDVADKMMLLYQS